MDVYINKSDNIVEELLKVIPISFLMSEEFKKRCLESDYYRRWNICSTKISLRDGNMFASQEEITTIIFENVCHELSNNSIRTLYKFITLVIKSYCEHEKTKLDLKGLRIVLHSNGIIKLTEIEKYDLNAPFTENIIVEISKWDEIKDAVTKLEKDCLLAEGSNDFSNVGNTCRHILIKLAQLVYDPKLHGDILDNGGEIGKAHILEMLSRFIAYSIPGKCNEEYRAYTNASIKLANMLTHKTNASRKDMMLSASATINLVYTIGIIGDKFKHECFI